MSPKHGDTTAVKPWGSILEAKCGTRFDRIFDEKPVTPFRLAMTGNLKGS
jgi:hypothetical protein